MTSRRLIIAAARTCVLLFCAVTALYAFIASSAFAYQQFIQPRVFHGVGAFADAHSRLAWLWLTALGLILWPHLRRGRPSRAAALAVGGWSSAGVAWISVHPVLPTLHDGTRSIVFGIAALAPIIGVAVVEHIAAWPHLRDARGPVDERARRHVEGRLFVACTGTALLLTAGYAVLASASIARAFEPDLLSSGLALGVGTSLVNHMLVFGAVFAALSSLARLGGRSVAAQYAWVLASGTALWAGLFTRLLAGSIGLMQVPARWAAVATGASIMLAWGGARLSNEAQVQRPLTSGLDVLFVPPAAGPSGRGLAIALASVLPLAWTFAVLSGRMDWDFALLKAGVVTVWILTFTLVYRATPQRDVPSWTMVFVCAAPILMHASAHPGVGEQHALARYAVHNPSFLLTDGLLRERQGSGAFDRYLRANTGLTDVTVAPVSIDFGAGLSPAPPSRRPHIFLFVIDSLRADYLSPFNPEVRFTPRLAEFASANLAFPNTFTRYGGTGMSMPAIWAGSALVHKQYVRPFSTMNALQELLDLNGYRRVQSRDHITEALWTGVDLLELDRGRDEMQFEFCATMEELGGALDGGLARGGPLFAQSRSLTLHIAANRKGEVASDAYRGFDPSYAAAVERIDRCFGQFIDRLKRLGLYDDSVVLFTSDHGEFIGEDGRWGHSYHMFPPVIQVPLLVHLPTRHQHEGVDMGAVHLTTDITPTLYGLLGYPARPADALAGQSLLMHRPADSAGRRRGSVVLAASYGAVYAVVSRNGRRLYIADAVQERDYAFERSSAGDLQWAEGPLDERSRWLGHLRIRRYIDTIARTYGLDRPF